MQTRAELFRIVDPPGRFGGQAFCATSDSGDTRFPGVVYADTPIHTITGADMSYSHSQTTRVRFCYGVRVIFAAGSTANSNIRYILLEPTAALVMWLPSQEGDTLFNSFVFRWTAPGESDMRRTIEYCPTATTAHMGDTNCPGGQPNSNNYVRDLGGDAPDSFNREASGQRVRGSFRTNNGVITIMPNITYCFRLEGIASGVDGPVNCYTTSADDTPMLSGDVPQITAITVSSDGDSTTVHEEGETVDLTPTANGGDDHMTDTLTYTWTQVVGMNDATAVTSGANYVGALTEVGAAGGRQFEVPRRFADEVTLYFRLVVRDDDGVAARTAAVMINGVNDAPMVTRAVATVDGAPAAQVRPDMVITLTAAASDAEAEAIRFAWACDATPMSSTTPSADLPDVDVTVANAMLAVAALTAPAVPMGAESVEVSCTVTATSGTPPMSDTDMVEFTIVVPSRADAAVEAVVLPEVLRNTVRGINNSIYNRIQTRQRADGKWQ